MVLCLMIWDASSTTEDLARGEWGAGSHCSYGSADATVLLE